VTVGRRKEPRLKTKSKSARVTLALIAAALVTPLLWAENFSPEEPEAQPQ